MKLLNGLALLAAVLIASAGIAPAALAADDAAATIRANTAAWIKAYNAGNADAVVSLYADDAVVMPPGAPVARGHAAIKQFLVKDIAGAQAAGVALVLTGKDNVGTSGDLAWHSGTYAVTDKAGKTIDTGKYMDVSRKTSGKWHMIRDIWNSDTPPPAAPPASMPVAPKK